MKSIFKFFLIACFFYSISASQSYSIPAFARKYSISCQTCHTPSIPKLKAYGDDFAGDGFRLEDYEAPRYYIETGDPELSLIRDLPLAVRMDGYVTYNMGDNEKSDLGTPFGVKILSGGTLSKNLSYYFYFYLYERGEIAGIEDAYLMYNDLFNVDFDIYAGQFQVSDPLFKRELRLSLEDYFVYTTRIGISDISMKYDRGLMFTYGMPSGTGIVLEIVNGNGIEEANAFKVFDKDKYKNFLLKVSQGIGENLSLGVVGYYGNEELINNENSSIKNTVMYAGADASLNFDNIFELNFQYLLRTDEQVFPSYNASVIVDDISTDGIMAEAIYSPKGDDSKWYALGLLNYVESDYDPADYRSLTFHLGYLLQRNVRLSAEYTWNFSDENNQFGIPSLGFVSAF